MSKRHYIEVVTLAAGGGDKSLFTYHADYALPIGQLVKVPLGRRQSLGVVTAKVKQPAFSTKLVAEISELPSLPEHLIKLAEWISQYYVTPLAKVYQALLPAAPWLKRPPKKTATINQIKTQPVKVTLQPQQTAALATISARSGSYLLHGATGSGKTRVYIELAKRAIAAGQSAILLVPEISLTPQLSQLLLAEFGKQVVLAHSGMTPANRRKAWQAVLNSQEPQIIIGPRSALFMPVQKLGLIVIDECHETSYKQEQAPRYHAIPTASRLRQLSGATLVLGSATPGANEIFLCQIGKLTKIVMPHPVHKANRQTPQIVDLHDKAQLHSHLISRDLLKQLRQTLDEGKQSLVFINRRGSARLLRCGNCDWVATCPNCQIPLTFHGDKGQLICHWCDYKQVPPAECPSCGSLELVYLGMGTKRAEQEISSLLPKATISRLDRDSFDPRTIETLFNTLKSGEVDVLIGTQMITKGLDLPNVESVGVMLADTMLYMPDFTASERAFQLLYQVTGRAGRRAGSQSRTVIQTYSPRHPAIVAAQKLDFDGFMAQELAQRKLMNYPPFVYLLKLSLARATRTSAQSAARELASKIKSANTGVELLGPAPSFIENLRGKFHWQIIVKSKNRQKLIQIVRELPPHWVHDLDPIDLL
jgi:primosomal protein N' (replication factor Y) (superfamily II helicase)